MRGFIQHKKIFLITSLSLWVALICGGMFWLIEYSVAPGKAAVTEAASVIPASVRLRPQLNVYLHPNCGCSRATISELSRLVAHAEGLADVHVYFCIARGKDESWTRTSLWKKAEQIPGVLVSTISEEEVKKLGITTSGQIIMYDVHGNRIFAGGITAGRGCEGDNDGRLAIEAYLREGKKILPQTHVFGCALVEN